VRAPEGGDDRCELLVRDDGLDPHLGDGLVAPRLADRGLRPLAAAERALA